MQKFNIPCIKTGDFAKLCNTNKRTLFHYDEIGLFSPAYTDEKGYRFYSETQCDVFFTITCLKDLGMPLSEIKTYIDNKNPTDLKKLLYVQKKKVEKELEHFKRIEKLIDTKTKLIDIGENIHFHGMVSDVMIVDEPQEYLIVSERLNSNSHDELFASLCNHIGYCNHENLNIGHAYGAIVSVLDMNKNTPDTYLYFFTKVSKVMGHKYMIKKKGKYAVIYLKGNYYDAEQAYNLLLEYIRGNKITAGEYCYKEAIWDELTVADENEYITKISIPILK